MRLTLTLALVAILTGCAAAGDHETGPLASGTPAAAAPKAGATSANFDLAFPAGWQTKPLTDWQRQAGMVVQASNNTTDSSVIVIAVDATGLTDRNVYIRSRRAAQESRLKDATHSDVTDVTVNGRPGKQFEVTGTELRRCARHVPVHSHLRAGRACHCQCLDDGCELQRSEGSIPGAC